MSSEDRLRELADRVAIRDLVARYAAAVDDRDFDAVLDCFTADGRLVRPPWAAEGRAELDAAYRRALGRYEWTVHAVHGSAVDLVGPDEATGFVGCHAEHALEGEVVLVAMRYRDEYRRVDGAWRFASRTIGFAYATPLAGLEAVSRRVSSVRWPGEAVEAYGLR